MVIEFFNKYFISPIQLDSGYNFVNTIVYAVIALILLYGIFKGLEKLNVNIDLKFFYALLPFIIFGASIRAFVDSKIIAYTFWTVSPGIWMLVTGIFLLCFAVSFIIAKYTKYKYWITCAGIGLGLVAVLYFWFWSKLGFTNTWAGLAIIGLAIGISALLYFIFKFAKTKWFSNTGFLPFPAHMLDASTTFIAVDFLGAVEKHPLTRIVGDWTGSAASLFALKLAILLPAIYLIQTEIKNKNLANYLLITITVLGLSEGLRNLITLILV